MADNAGATEVERLLVRLVGDGSSYQKMMQTAQATTQAAAAQVEQAAKRIEGFQHGLEGFARGTLSILGSLGVAGGLWASFEKFSKFEEGQLRMKAAIEVSGQALDQVLPKFQAYAALVEQQTMVTKGQTMALLQQATTRGLNADKAKEAATMAIALAGATGQEAESMMHAAIALQQGNTHIAKRMLGLHNLKDETEVMTKINKMMASGLAQQKAISETAMGGIEKLKRSLGMFSTEVGKIVSDQIKPFVKGLQELVDWYKNLGPEVKQNTIYFIAALGAIVGLQPALSTMKYLLAPIGSLWGVLSSAVGFLISPLGLLTAGIVGVTAAWVYFSGNGGNAVKWFTDRWQELKDELAPAIQGVTDALKAGEIALAFDIAWAQVQLSFAKATQRMREAWQLFALNFKVIWIDVSEQMGRIWQGITANIAARYIILQRQLKIISQETADEMQKNLLEDILAETAARQQAAQDALKQAGITGVGNTAQIQEQINALTKRRDDLVAQGAEAAAKVPPPKIDKDVLKLPDLMANGMKKAEESSAKLQANLRGSTSAAQALADYSDLLKKSKTGTGETSGYDPLYAGAQAYKAKEAARGMIADKKAMDKRQKFPFGEDKPAQAVAGQVGGGVIPAVDVGKAQANAKGQWNDFAKDLKEQKGFLASAVDLLGKIADAAENPPAMQAANVGGN